MENRNPDIRQKARGYAFLLLKFRLRSEKEIYERLKKKKIPEEIIRETLAFLKEKKFIDDNLFAQAWIASRLKKPLGLGRIKEELRIKGIAQEIIDSQLSEIKDGYCEEEIVAAIARQRFAKLKNIDPQKAKRRVYAWFLRRGFSADAVIEAINQV